MRFSSAIEFINRNDSYILTGHETPDGDAIGSECAMYAALRDLGKRVRIINADPAPRVFQFIDTDGVIETLSDQSQLPEDIGRWCLLVLDTNDLNNIGAISSVILPVVGEYFVIDHHENGGDGESGNIIEADASSTCEVLYDLFAALPVELTLPMAQALYAGIVYDTGSFIYPKTTARTFGIAQDLVDRGVVPNEVYRNIYESNTISYLMLQSRVLGTLELFFNKHVAVQVMLKSTLIDCDASYEEGQTFINVPLKSEAVKASVFFKENMEGVLRCSLRSKGNIDVAAIAAKFGGGGHKTAAGFKVSKSLEETRQIVLEMLHPYFE